MSIRSRVESIRRRLDAATAPGPREFQSALRLVTLAALGQGPSPTAADIDSRIGMEVLGHLRIHAAMRATCPTFDRVAKGTAVQQLAETWPTKWSNTALDDGLRIARAILDGRTFPAVAAERGLS